MQYTVLSSSSVFFFFFFFSARNRFLNLSWFPSKCWVAHIPLDLGNSLRSSKPFIRYKFATTVCCVSREGYSLECFQRVSYQSLRYILGAPRYYPYISLEYVKTRVAVDLYASHVLISQLPEYVKLNMYTRIFLNELIMSFISFSVSNVTLVLKMAHVFRKVIV